MSSKNMTAGRSALQSSSGQKNGIWFNSVNNFQKFQIVMINSLANFQSQIVYTGKHLHNYAFM